MGVTIRAATLADVPTCVAMGQRFRRETAYREILAENPDQMRANGLLLLESPEGIFFVADHVGTLTGMIGLLVAPHPLSGERVAMELFWWSEDGRDGVRLLRAAETVARALGAVGIMMIAPSDRVGMFYERFGYRLIERSYMKRFTAVPERTPPPEAARILVLDDVLDDPVAYRQRALAREFKSIELTPDVVFHGIAVCGDELTLPHEIRRRYGLDSSVSFFRQSPDGQGEPNFIHTDLDMGEWTAILYLTPDPPDGDGTAFWRHTPTGQVFTISGPTSMANLDELAAWRDRDQWECWHQVPAKFNRVVLFPGSYYHSRALYENYGTMGETARLIQVLFGVGEVPSSFWGEA